MLGAAEEQGGDTQTLRRGPNAVAEQPLVQVFDLTWLEIRHSHGERVYAQSHENHANRRKCTSFPALPRDDRATESVPMQLRHDTGISLLELLVGLAIVAVLTGMATPGFLASLRAAAVRTAAYELMAGLQQARADSILESRPGVLCPSDGADCLGANVPARAWMSFLEVSGRPVELRRHILPAGVVVRASRAPLRFWPAALAASPTTLTICDERRVARARAIVISQSGRARFAEQAQCGA
jgi:Tfp pilus assembly protein FimT